MITINENRQEYFDKTVEHMARQGRRSISDGGCLYRSPENLRCNFGIFIPDKQYSPALEGKVVESLVQLGVVEFTGEVDVNFASALQWVHDYGYNLNMVKKDLYEIASKYNLNTPKIELITEWK